MISSFQCVNGGLVLASKKEPTRALVKHEGDADQEGCCNSWCKENNTGMEYTPKS